MAFKVLPDGSIEADTAREALELQDAILARRRAKRTSSATSGDRSAGVADGPPKSKYDQLRRFLEVIHDAGAGGMTTDDLAQTVGVGGPKGLGPLSSRFRRQLEDLGFDLDKVAVRFPGADGSRRWRSEKLIEKALEKVRQAAAEEKGGGR
ncbi:MAG: hypothetical protein ACF8XB_13290 [Planctomycetota bacterium JB042]